MMSQIKPLANEAMTPQAQDFIQSIQQKLGWVPDMYRVMAHSPHVLAAYVQFNTSLAGAAIGAKLSEMIALATAEHNGCSYCLSAHTMLGKKAGLTEESMRRARRFEAEDHKSQAGLEFVQRLLSSPGTLATTDADMLKTAGCSDGDILEIVAIAVRNIFTNYINIIAGTAVDWPVPVHPFNIAAHETK